MDIQEALSELGLNKNKGKVYLAALSVGIGSAQEIAKQAGLPRTTVHEILQSLLEKGLISFTSKQRNRTYVAEPPTRLKVLLKEKEELLNAIMPELSLFSTNLGSRPKVRFYDSVEGIKTVFEDTLTVTDKSLKGILSMEDLYKVPGKAFMDNYVKRRVSSGITLQVIRSEAKEIEESWPSSVKENRELHYATNMVFPMTMYFYDNKVVVIGTQKEKFGMIIESADLYRTMINFFDVLWQITKVAKRRD